MEELAASIVRQYPGMRGYTRPNLFRMRQFYEAYRSDKKVSALLTQLPWTHHLLILGQAKLPEERTFYLQAVIAAKWSSRELERQIRTQAFRRQDRRSTKCQQRWHKCILPPSTCSRTPTASSSSS